MICLGLLRARAAHAVVVSVWTRKSKCTEGQKIAVGMIEGIEDRQTRLVYW